MSNYVCSTTPPINELPLGSPRQKIDLLHTLPAVKGWSIVRVELLGDASKQSDGYNLFTSATEGLYIFSCFI